MLKIKVIQRSQIYVTHYPMVIHSCTRYGITVNKQKAMAQTQSHVKDIEVNVPDTWTHVPNMVVQCQIKIKVRVGHEDLSKTLSYIPIYPPEPRSRGCKNGKCQDVAAIM